MFVLVYQKLQNSGKSEIQNSQIVGPEYWKLSKIAILYISWELHDPNTEGLDSSQTWKRQRRPLHIISISFIICQSSNNIVNLHGLNFLMFSLKRKLPEGILTKAHAETHLSRHCGRVWEEEGVFTHWHNQLLDTRLHGLSLPKKIPSFSHFPWRKMLNFQRQCSLEG